MACKLCGSGNTSSLGMRTNHVLCRSCGGHEYDEMLITKCDWEDWVNERVSTPRSRPSNAVLQPDGQASLPLV